MAVAIFCQAPVTSYSGLRVKECLSAQDVSRIPYTTFVNHVVCTLAATLLSLRCMMIVRIPTATVLLLQCMIVLKLTSTHTRSLPSSQLREKYSVRLLLNDASK